MIHNIEPIFDENSRILILGSFPSVKSREEQFYYAHPQNRFWRVLEKAFNEKKCKTVTDKKRLLQKYNIAVWDVVHSCEVSGSSDSSITNAEYNDLSKILSVSSIEKIICNGNTAYNLLIRSKIDLNDIECVKLPSTSPANAIFSFERLFECWKKELNDI